MKIVKIYKVIKEIEQLRIDEHIGNEFEKFYNNNINKIIQIIEDNIKEMPGFDYSINWHNRYNELLDECQNILEKWGKSQGQYIKLWNETKGHEILTKGVNQELDRIYD